MQNDQLEITTLEHQVELLRRPALVPECDHVDQGLFQGEIDMIRFGLIEAHVPGELRDIGPNRLDVWKVDGNGYP